jgi:crotonobetainyl-CoA:carnitine CoA-transferase CaiB-like acyl-CoA transferase
VSTPGALREHDGLPLEGVLVLDLGQIYNGPYAGWLLGRMGARVIKVESPRGDLIRQRTRDSRGPYSHLMLNSGKSSIVLDLADADGHATFLRLVDRADVVIENFSAGAMGRLGLGWDVLHARNPRLVLASSSGFGQDGPYAHVPAMDLSVQAMSGLIASTGFSDGPPVKSGAAITDFLAGTHLAVGIATALYDRERTGRGRHVECSMLDAAMIAMCSSLSAVMDVEGDAPERTGNRHPALSVSPYNVYQASDGWVAINCPSQRHWELLAGVMGRADLIADPRFIDPVARTQAMDDLDAIVEGWTSQHSRDELWELMTGVGVPCGPVRSAAELLDDPHLRARGSFIDVEDPVRGVLPLPTGALRFHPGRPPQPPRPAPDLGADTERVLEELLSAPSVHHPEEGAS